MMTKMGWKDGQGLGKNEQGMSTHLRVVRRIDESLGIGAKSTDRFGEEGYSSTHSNFTQVLSMLQTQHVTDETLNKKEKKRKKEKEHKSSKSDDRLILATNRVSAGHARKMRESKNLQSKSEEDLAAIFGKKRDVTVNPSVWGRLNSMTTESLSSSTSEAATTKKDRIDEKKRKRRES
jgi:Pin2-interacting protein X1